MQHALRQQQFHRVPAMWPPSNTVTTSVDTQNAQCKAAVTHLITTQCSGSAQEQRTALYSYRCKVFWVISSLSEHPVTTVRGEGGIGAQECQDAWVVVRLAVEGKVGSWILTSLKPHRVTSSSRQILHSRVFYTSSKHKVASRKLDNCSNTTNAVNSEVLKAHKSKTGISHYLRFNQLQPTEAHPQSTPPDSEHVSPLVF